MNFVKAILLIFILFVLGLFFYDVFRGGGQIDPKAIQEAVKAAGGIVGKDE